MPSPKSLLWLVLAAGAALGVAAQEPPVTEEDFSEPEIESGDALASLAQMAFDGSEDSLKLAKRTFGGSCSLSKMQIRREWRTLTKAQRRSYIAAVQCLQTKPSLFDPAQIPAAKSLFDDFVGVHLFQTPYIHVTATFLTWHRYFVWTYEQKLRGECGYTGPLPYWEWGFDVNDPSKSPVFDGSDTSMGSNGAFVEHEGIQMVQAFSGNTINMEPGSGGGCVTKGPFKDMSVHFGPIALPAYGSPTFESVPDPINDHDRCLKRDLNAWVAKRFTSFRNTTSLILQNHNIEMFQAIMQGDDRYVVGELGVHGGGHYIVGGDPGGDPFISPGDPFFYLHHAQIDRIYWIWQMLDFQNRQGVHGTGTIQDMPPSANVTVEDTVDIEPIAGPVKIKDLMNTLGGSPLCYVYL